MIKQLMIVLLIISICGICSAQEFIGGSDWSAAGGGEDYSDITFYHNTEALGDATKSAGSGTVTYNAGILLETTLPIVGSGSWDNNNDGWDNTVFSLASNLDMTNGRIGFYTRFNEMASGAICWADVTNDFIVKYSSTENLSVTWRGKTTGLLIALGLTLSTGVDYFWEFKFDGDTVTIYLDGNLKGTQTSTTQAITSSTMNNFSLDGNAWDMFQDQIICSSDKDRDIYAIRNTTDFS